jgi:hypothetical protein
MLLGGTHVTTAIKAVYEDGVLKPKEPLELAEHSEVEVLVFAGSAAAHSDDPTGWKTWASLIGCVKDGPADGSERHDDYLYRPDW